MEDILRALSGDAERAYGAARAAELRGSLERLAGALTAVREYPLAPVVEPAILPDAPRQTPEDENQRA